VLRVALPLLLLVVLAGSACAMPRWMEEVLKRIGDAYNDTIWGRW
jgi:hypothetical protein